MVKTRLALFASGNGSNALNIIDTFKNHPAIEVGFVLTNNSTARVIPEAQKRMVETLVLSNDQVADAALLSELCKKHHIDCIILAGYLRLIPAAFIEEYTDNIINIHPSLLPNYGGKGMYGENVHKAVLKASEPESGITVHYVNNEFDKGQILAQFHCTLDENETLDTLKSKIHQLEQAYFPVVIEKTLLIKQHV